MKKELFLPVAVFIITWIIHYLWLILFPEQKALQDQWISIGQIPSLSPWNHYIQSQSYYLSFSYALSFAFAAHTLYLYWKYRFCSTKYFAIGGMTFPWVLALVGCFLIGCCGSPMLAVYLSLFGASFLPFAKQLVAILTTFFISIGWMLLHRKMKVTKCECS